MINNGQSTLLLYCCEDVKSHRSGGDTVPLRQIYHFKLQLTSQDDKFHMMESNNSFSLNKNNKQNQFSFAYCSQFQPAKVIYKTQSPPTTDLLVLCFFNYMGNVSLRF